MTPYAWLTRLFSCSIINQCRNIVGERYSVFVAILKVFTLATINSLVLPSRGPWYAKTSISQDVVWSSSVIAIYCGNHLIGRSSGDCHIDKTAGNCLGKLIVTRGYITPLLWLFVDLPLASSSSFVWSPKCSEAISLHDHGLVWLLISGRSAG